MESDCPICIDTMSTPFALQQCKHQFHATCVIKSMDTYLAAYGTEWQTVPCPICRKRISFHIILSNAIKSCDFSEVVEIIRPENLFTECIHGSSLLHVAVIAGRLAVVKHLVKMGLPVDVPDNFGLTPLYYAAFNGHLEIVKYFVEHFSVNIHCANLFDQTILDMARKNNHTETVAYLEGLGARTGSGPDSVNLDDPKRLVKVINALCRM